MIKIIYNGFCVKIINNAFVYKSFIFNMYMYKLDLTLDNL